VNILSKDVTHHPVHVTRFEPDSPGSEFSTLTTRPKRLTSCKLKIIAVTNVCGNISQSVTPYCKKLKIDLKPLSLVVFVTKLSV
jgi:hypothetical protein